MENITGELLVRVPIENDGIEEGDETFKLKVTPVGGHTTTATGTIQDNQPPAISDPNDPANPQYPAQTFDPETGDYELTVDEDTPTTGKIGGNDPEGFPVKYEVTKQPEHGTLVLDPETGEYTYTPDPDYNGPDQFEVTVKDGSGGETPVTVVVDFIPEQDAFDDTADTAFNTPVTVDVLDNDKFEGTPVTITHVDGQVITEDATITLSDGKGTVKLEGGQLIFTPAEGVEGDVVFEYTATTEKGSPETANVTVTVAENLVPVPADPDAGKTPENKDYPKQTFDPETGDYELTVDEDTPTNGKITGNDPEGFPVEYVVTKEPEHGTLVLVPETGEYIYTPDPDYNGPDEFEVTIKDGSGGETPVTVVVKFNPDVDVKDDQAETEYGKEVVIDVLENDDFDGNDPVITEINGQPISEGQTVVVDKGSVKLENGKLVFTPGNGVDGDVTFKYTAKTEKGSPEEATVTVTVKEQVYVPDPVEPTVPVLPPNNQIVPGTISPDLPNDTTDSKPPTDWAAPPLQDLVIDGPAYNYSDMPIFTVNGVVMQGGERSPGNEGLHLVKTPSSQISIVDELSTFSLPTSTFRHSDANARVSLEATLADGSPLPDWLTFDPDSGRFTGKPPKGSGGTMDLKVMARDEQGNVAFTQFLLRIVEEDSNDALLLKQLRELKAAEQQGDDQEQGDQQVDENALGDEAGLTELELLDEEELLALEEQVKQPVVKKLAGMPSLAEQFRQHSPRTKTAELLASLQHVMAKKI